MSGIFKVTIFSIACFTCNSLLAQVPAATGDSTVIITKGMSGNGAGFTVTGVITDAATGKALSAINVSVPYYSAALTSDNGSFSIKVPGYQSTLSIKGEGFQTKEIALKGRSNVSASLYEETFSSVYDNAILPMGAKPLNQTTSAVASVSTEGSWNRSLETPDSYLQGKVSGLQPVMRSGTPNVGAYLLLRGYNSLYGSNQPLIVIDGNIFDTDDAGSSLIGNHYTNALANIDVKDIENITVVKDAVSLYGAKAANGVILITTTHAKQLATKIDAAVYAGINFRPARLPVMRAADYRVYLSDILKTRGWTPDKIQEQPYMNDDPSNPEYSRYHNETDWQDLVLKNTSTSNVYLKVTGGDNIARYALSIGYMKNGGVTRNTDLTKYNVRFNGDLNLSRKLTASTNLSYTYYEQNLKDQGLALSTNPLFLSLIKAPFLNKNEVSDAGAISPNLADTDTLGVSNPAAAISSVRDNSKVYRFFGSINFRYQLSQHINLFSLVGVTVDEVREQTFIPRKGISNDTLSNAVADTRLGGQAKRLFALFNDTYVHYDRSFNRIHRLQTRAGIRYLASTNEQDYASGFNSPTDEFISVGTGVSILRKTGGDFGKYNWMNTYLGVDYSLADRYFLTYNMAVDASSRFGSNIPGALKVGDVNLAVLPSIGAAWLISSEKFMASANFFDQLKLRASFGKTGNDDIGNYTAKQLYVSQNLLGLQGLVRANIGNPALQWESNTKLNAGIDAALFNERFNVSLDVFRNNTTNMISYEPVFAASGFDYAITNSGSMKTTGLDVSISGRIVNSKLFKWDLGLVFSSYKNTITRIPGGPTLTSFGGATAITQEGSPANRFFGYATNGVYASDEAAAADGLARRLSTNSSAAFQGGDVRFTDLNGDKIIDENDRQVIGDPNPDFTGGFTNRVSYGGLSFEALFTFSKGNDLYNGTRAALESGSTTRNQLEGVINRWRVPGQVTNFPRASWGDPLGNSGFSDRWIEDGSFLRMKAVSLSYTFQFKPSSALKSSTVYITGNNLLTFSKYLGYDPEFMAAESVFARGVDVGLEPNFKSVTAGIRIGL